ncbi:MAG: putative nucleotidyltransferase with HDIG domain [Phycisphaerales bacterium]
MKPTSKANPKRRRTVLQVKDTTWRDRIRDLVERTHLLWGAMVTVGFVVLVSVIVNWSREQPLIAVGQVMTQTHTVRQGFTYQDEAVTERQRTDAAQRTLRIFVADQVALDDIRSSLEQLPQKVASVSNIAEVNEEIRRQFGLSTERLAALQAATVPLPPLEPDPSADAGDQEEPATDAAADQAGGEPAVTPTDPTPAEEQAPADPASADPASAEPAPQPVTPQPVPQPRVNPGLEQWNASVVVLDGMLRTTRPLLSHSSYQTATQEGLATRVELVVGAERVQVARSEVINLGNTEALQTEVQRIVEIAGFTGPLAEIVRERLTREPRRPTFGYDAGATTEAQQRAAEAVSVPPTMVPKGQVVFMRGDTLDPSQYDLYRREAAEFKRQSSAVGLWMRRLGVAGAVIGLSGILAGYVGAFSPQIARRSARILWLAIVMVVALAATTVSAVIAPQFMVLSMLTPTILVAVLLGVAYSPRTALGLGAVQAALAVLALDQGFSSYILTMIGIGTAVSLLGDLRRRRAIVRMSIAVAAVQFVAAICIGLIELPISSDLATKQTFGNAVMAALSGLLAGMITLFVLPYIEKVFDIATGMTLIELRDPKQPLLREMQQLAPGTYNHSLNVASIAESAADSIGADSLLTYVGCLYHDIGKINKPEYFVENQARGHNKHDKLSPAMSLLVIVGHVKDGLEMARENNLPKALHHFIEAHHGTTLVEYFFKRAQQNAGAGKPGEPGCPEPDPEQLPSEVDYRYPGPRPRTKEVAIVMLADAVESATRTLPEPTPSRIDALVRDFANRRLMDGQFDDCDLTLKELHTISESISKTVASIYHARISYSGDKPGKSAEAKPKKPETEKGPDTGEPPQEKSA